MGYTRSVFAGFGWIGSYRILAKVIVFAKALLIYRYLGPDEVGVLGIVLVALGLSEMLTETGINTVLVQDKRPLSHFIDTAFVISILRGLSIAILLAGSSLFVPKFFGLGQLQQLFLFAALIPLVKGVINPAIAQFVKQMEFSKEAVLRIALIGIESVLAIVFVRANAQAYAVLWAMLIAGAIEVIYSHLFLSLHPRLRFDRKVLHTILSTGKWINASSVLYYIETNFDNLVVAKVLGTSSLGLYQTAFNIARSGISEGGTIVSQVTLPFFVQIASDGKRLRRAFLRTFLLLILALCALATLLNIPLVHQVLRTILRSKWDPLYVLFVPLALHAVLAGSQSLIVTLCVVKKTLYPYTAVAFVNVLLMFFCVWYGSTQAGLVGAAWGVLAAKALIFPLFLALVWRTVRT